MLVFARLRDGRVVVYYTEFIGRGGRVGTECDSVRVDGGMRKGDSVQWV
jgi:hypothetical protein